MAAATNWRGCFRKYGIAREKAEQGLDDWVSIITIRCTDNEKNEIEMLHYAVTFFVIAIIAAVLGFTGIAGTATSIAWILFVGFLILAVLSFLFGRRSPV